MSTLKASKSFTVPGRMRLNLRVYTGSLDGKPHVWAALFQGRRSTAAATTILFLAEEQPMRNGDGELWLGTARLHCGDQLDQVCAWLAEQGIEVATA